MSDPTGNTTIRHMARHPPPPSDSAGFCTASQVLPVQPDRTPPKRPSSGKLNALRSGHVYSSAVLTVATQAAEGERRTGRHPTDTQH
jgi:hypothetical protein